MEGVNHDRITFLTIPTISGKFSHDFFHGRVTDRYKMYLS